MVGGIQLRDFLSATSCHLLLHFPCIPPEVITRSELPCLGSWTDQEEAECGGDVTTSDTQKVFLLSKRKDAGAPKAADSQSYVKDENKREMEEVGGGQIRRRGRRRAGTCLRPTGTAKEAPVIHSPLLVFSSW